MNMNTTINSKTSTKRLFARVNTDDTSQELMYLLHIRMWRWIVEQYKLKRYIHPGVLKEWWIKSHLDTSHPSTASVKLSRRNNCFLCIVHRKNQGDIGVCDNCPLGSCLNTRSAYEKLCGIVVTCEQQEKLVKYAQKILNCV